MASIDDVLDITPLNQYTATASQTAFTYSFPIFVDADIVVDIDGVVHIRDTKTHEVLVSVDSASGEVGHRGLLPEEGHGVEQDEDVVLSGLSDREV